MGKLKLSNETKTSLIALALIAITALANIGPSVIAALSYFGVIPGNPIAAAAIGAGFGTIGGLLINYFCDDTAVTLAVTIGCAFGWGLVAVGIAFL